MTVPVYVVSSHMIGQKSRLNMVADNIANANTSGFKKLGMNFEELVSRKQSETVASFNKNRGTYFDMSQGGVSRTDNSLDLAIKGAGFFATQQNGQTRYTRNGNFTINAEGNLTTSSGALVLDPNKGAINIPNNSKKIVINNDGTISDQNGIIGTVGVFKINQPQKLIRTGDSGYIYNADEPEISTNSSVMQGFIENSNINPIEETVTLTELNRSYQASARLVSSIEDLEQRAIRDLSRLPQ